MAISITSNGSRVKLVIAGCTGECSAGHNHFEEYEWDRSKHGEVNVVGRLFILYKLGGQEAIDSIKNAFDAGFNKYPVECEGAIWTDWTKLFWTDRTSATEIWKHLIEKKLAENRTWIKCPECVRKNKSFGEVLYIHPSFGTCPPCKI